MVKDPELLKQLLKEGNILPMEEMLEISKKKGSLLIGIPKETSFQERRVPLVPEAVSFLIANGHQVRIETGAGDPARRGYLRPDPPADRGAPYAGDEDYSRHPAPALGAAQRTA